MRVARAAAAVLALVTAAWFALGARQAHDTSVASSIIPSAGSMTAAQAAHARSLLRTAGTLNPDTQVDLLRGVVLLRRRQRSSAERVFEDITRREPMNIQAWVLLAESFAGNNRSLGTAVKQLALLDPLDARSHR